MNNETLTQLRDALAAAIDLGAGHIPPTYLSGVNHAWSWAERKLKVANISATAETPVVDRLRKQLKAAK